MNSALDFVLLAGQIFIKSVCSYKNASKFVYNWQTAVSLFQKRKKKKFLLDISSAIFSNGTGQPVSAMVIFSKDDVKTSYTHEHNLKLPPQNMITFGIFLVHKICCLAATVVILVVLLSLSMRNLSSTSDQRWPEHFENGSCSDILIANNSLNTATFIT